ncbi:MAG TPA: choice-of-anchor D domain-containing protein [Terriglobales bacterium]
MKRLLFLCTFTLMLTGLIFAQSAPVPFINNPLVPARVAPGRGAFTLTINGSGFTTNSVVYWNGSVRATTYVSSSQLQAQINGSDVAKAGFGWVTVLTQGTGATSSNVAYLEIGGTAKGVGFQAIPFNVSNPGVVAVGDFNNDGILDFVVGYENGTKGGSEVFLGKGSGEFKPPVDLGTEAVYSMVVGDFNGDGNLDIAADTQYGHEHSTRLFVLLGNGDGTFTKLPPQGGGPLAYAADFNNDGKLDLLVYFEDGRDSSYGVLLGNGNGTFQSPCCDLVQRPAFDDAYQFVPVAIGDFNGDGYIDYATVGYDSKGKGLLYIYRGEGNGHFGLSSTAYMRYPGDTLAAADVNGDGILDIVSDGVSVMLGNGDGTFHNYFSYEMPTQPGSVSLADFNGDGKLDLAAGMYLLLGHGNGTFASPVTFANMFLGMPSVLGPFNPDGDFDLIGVDGEGGTLTLFKNVPAYLAPINLAFGQQPIGITTAPQIATLTNYSRGPASFTNLQFGFTGPNANDFSQTNNCGGSLALNQTCQIQVTFTPSIVGNESASLTASYSGSQPVTLPLTGTGTDQTYTVTLTPSSLTFPLTLAGQTAQPQGLTLTNTGNQPVTISGISNPPAPFSQQNDCPATLPVGSSCGITVSFAPTNPGTFNGTISVTDNAQGSPQQSSLSGTGTAVTFNPVSLDFGNQPVGQSSVPLKFVLNNLGTNALTITQIQITGADPKDFTQQNNCGSSLAGQSSCTITVTFKPTAKGARSAGVQFTDSDPTSPQTEPLSGKGT